MTKEQWFWEQHLTSLTPEKVREEVNQVLIDFAREINGSNVNLRPTKEQILSLLNGQKQEYKARLVERVQGIENPYKESFNSCPYCFDEAIQACIKVIEEVE